MDPAGFDLFSSWLLLNMDAFNEWMRGRLTSRQISDMISADVQRESDYVLQELHKSCELLLVDIPEIVDEILRLRRGGARVVLATDNIIDFSNITVSAQNLNDVFDGVLNSAELGVLKSDKHGGFFDEYLRRYDIDTSEAVLIDDSDKVEAALTKHPLRQIKVTGATDTLEVLRGL